MNGLELAAVITALGGFIAAVGALAIGVVRLFDETKDTKARIAALHKEIETYRAQLAKYDRQQELSRRDVILIGEALSDAKHDTAAMALLINQLFNQFKESTGKAPDVNIEMLRHMRTIGYVTGPLGPLDVEALKR